MRGSPEDSIKTSLPSEDSSAPERRTRCLAHRGSRASRRQAIHLPRLRRRSSLLAPSELRQRGILAADTVEGKRFLFSSLDYPMYIIISSPRTSAVIALSLRLPLENGSLSSSFLVEPSRALQRSAGAYVDLPHAMRV